MLTFHLPSLWPSVGLCASVAKIPSMRRLLLLLLAGCTLLTAADPYAAWAQGRPAESVPALIAAAGERWDGWFDAGLAAAAAGDRGRAVACLARAHDLAPERPEPRDALRALAAPLPATWCERAGPFAAPGQGPLGAALAALAGLCLGGAGLLRRGRQATLALGAALLLAVAPGALALWLDGRTAWTANVRDTSLLDSAGNPLRDLPAGTLLERLPQPAWNGRVVVRMPDGGSAFLATADLAVE